MDDTNAKAAQQIHDCWRNDTVIDALSPDQRPATPEQGYAVQHALASLRDEAVVGWKIAATAEAGRSHINVDRPLAGRLYRSIVHDDGATLAFGLNRMAVAEAEVVFIFGRDLPVRDSPWSEDEVADAVSGVAPGLEFPDSRFSDFTIVGTAGLIADNACAREFVLGGATAAPSDLNELDNLTTRLLINGEEVTNGFGRDALGGPLKAAVWLANTLREQGIGLRAGEFVTTGVTGKPSPVSSGDHVTTDLGAYGRVNAKLVD